MGCHTWFYRPIKEGEIITGNHLRERFKGKSYIQVTTHDLFRVPHYPDDKLGSYRETLSFIESNSKRVYFPDDLLEERLKEFWNKYPDGLITFG